LNTIPGIIPIAKELVKGTSVGMVAQSLNEAENAIKQVKIAAMKIEEVVEKVQNAVDKAKVRIMI
jgi:hypothetical protein